MKEKRNAGEHNTAQWPELPDLPAGDRNTIGLIWMLEGHQRPPTASELRDLHRRCMAAAARRRAGRRRKRKDPTSWAQRIIAIYYNALHRPHVMARVRSLQPLPGERLGEFLDRRYSALIKPWKGRVGRSTSAAVRAEKSKGRMAQALELHTSGLSDKVIAQRLRVDVKTVQRALKGKRKRSRTRAKR